MLKVLMIDDSKAVHAFVEMCLSGHPYQVTHTYDGQQGVDMFRSGATFDFILLDWEMPVKDGPTTLSEIRALSTEIPIIMMTTRNAFEDITLALGRGADEYTLKPFTKDILLDKIVATLEARGRNVA